MDRQAVEARTGQIPSEHLGFVDAAKGLGMAAIIWGHMDYLWSTSSIWFSSFKIAVFYVVVGLLKAHRFETRGQEDSCLQVLKKRFYSLVIPYAVYSLLSIPMHMAFAAVFGGSVSGAFKGDVILTVTLRGVATLWFLPTLLIAELLFAAARAEGWTLTKRLLVCILLPALLCAVCYIYQGMDIPGADRIWVQVVRNLFVVLVKSVSGFWFMLCGYLIYRRWKPARLGRLPILIALLAVNLALSLLSPDLDFNSFRLGTYAPVFYINGVLGSVAVLELLRWLEARVSLRPLVWCGKHSLFLMATHLPWYIAPVILIYGKRLYKAAAPNVPYFLLMVAEFAVLMLIEALLLWCKEKAKSAITRRCGIERPISKAIKYL